MRALVLCGGQGLRIKGSFDDIPKPLIALHGRPLLAYILDGYIAAGIKDFVLLVGREESMFRGFASSHAMGDISIRVLQTGLDTPTGGRLKQAEPLLGEDDCFFATYGDGVSNVDFSRLLGFHRASARMATLTAIRPQLPFGLLELEGDGAVTAFWEKPIMNQYSNGGFFVFQRSVLAGLRDSSDLETDVLPALSAQGQLGAFRHTGFWKNMDTYKDYVSLNAINLAEQIRLP